MNKLCLHQSIPCLDVPIHEHLHHCIPTRGHSHHGTLPWEHSHHGINMRTSTIMNKLYISIFAWDTCIIRNCICIFVKKHLYQNQNLGSHHILLAFIEKMTFKLMVQSLSSAWLRAWQLYFAFVKTRKDEKGIKKIQMKNKFKRSTISFMHNHTWYIASDICFLIWNRYIEGRRVLHPI